MNYRIAMNDELYHHGIDGMHWGVRNGPPYPLDSKTHNKVVSRSKDSYGIKESKKDYKQSKKEYHKAFNKAYRYSSNHPITQNYGRGKKKSDSLWDDAYDKANKLRRDKQVYKNNVSKYKEDKRASSKLSDKQKLALKIGAGIVATGLVAYGAYKLGAVDKFKKFRNRNVLSAQQLKDMGIDVIEPNRIKFSGANKKIGIGNLGKASIEKGSKIGRYIDADGLPRMTNPRTDDEILNAINPGRVAIPGTKKKIFETIRGSSENCMLCTTSYELQKRGYDIKAGFSDRGFTPQGLFPKIYKDYRGLDRVKGKNAVETYQNIIDHIDKYEDGARGNIIVYWNPMLGSGGHSMIWEKQNGKVVFKDGQTGVIYKDFANEILKMANYDDAVNILRTDNLTIDPDGIKQFMNLDAKVSDTYKKNMGRVLTSKTAINTYETVGVTAAGIASNKYDKQQQKNYAIRRYKQEHPETKMSDSEIWASVQNSRKKR